MKNIRNTSLAVLLAAMMAACSSTRDTGLGGTSGTTGMDSGSSTDLLTASETTHNTSSEYSNRTIQESNANEDPYDFSLSMEDAVQSAARVPNIWLIEALFNDAAPMYYIMNGYQGPLNYKSFSNFSSSKSFLPLVAESSIRETELSYIARQNTENAEVKAFADMMVRHYSNGAQELHRMISAQKYGNPDLYGYSEEYGNTDENCYSKKNRNSAEYTDDYKTFNDGSGNASVLSETGSINNGMDSRRSIAYEMNMLRNLTGRDFDRQYMRIMFQDHYQAVALFTSAAESDNPQIRNFAKKTLPVLQAHLAQAAKITNSLL